MDPGDEAQPDREQLESRVEELEATVSKMLPGRRGVLKGLGAAAIGGAAVGGATGGASGQSAAGQIGTASEPVDVEGAQGNFESVNTDELSGIYTHIVTTTEELESALSDAEASPDVSIGIAPGIYQPSDLPCDFREGFEINGVFPGRDSFTFDGIILGDSADPSGAIIDCNGGNLFEVDDRTSFSIKKIGVRDVTSFIDTGAPDVKGLSHGEIENIAIDQPTHNDYVFKMWNIQGVDMDKILFRHTKKAIKVVGENQDTLNLQPANSEWGHIVVGTDNEGSLSVPVVDINAETEAVNFIKSSRFQIIDGGDANGNVSALRFRGNPDVGDAQCTTHVFDAIDIEGPFKRHLEATGQTLSNRFEYAGNASATDYDVYLDGEGDSLTLNSKYITVYSGTPNNHITGRAKSIDGVGFVGAVRIADELINNGENGRIATGNSLRPVKFFDEYAEFRKYATKAYGNILPKRGTPSTSELAGGERMVYTSDGTDSHNVGDLVSARNDGGTIVSQVIAQASNDA